jgi:predicted Zn-dependent protease
MRAHWLAVAVALMALGGCATNPVTGRSQFIMVSERQAISESAAAYNSMVGQLGKKKSIETGTARVEKVREITDRLIAQAVRFRPETAKWKWEVTVINEPKTVNAFCMAGGKMAIYSGMWDTLKATDDEIAQVMGHEIGHALANHTQERMSIAMGVGAATTIAAIAIQSGSRGSAGGDLALTGMQIAALTAITLPNSREGESEADQIGIELAARAGYDPHAAVTLWDKMGRLGGDKAPPEFLSTHPSAETRAARLKALVPKVEPYYLQAKANPEAAPRFLNAKEAANERVVTRPGELTPEQYADKVSREGDTMTFHAERFERFKRGDTVLSCRGQCVFGYTARRGDWKKLYERRQWRELALSVVEVGYLSDLSYFLLAESAAGLGFGPAAAAYYKRAVDAGREYGCGENCDGLPVRQKSLAALK